MSDADGLSARVAAAGFVEELLDRVPDIVHFVKDTAGRCVAVNQTLARRCGVKRPDQRPARRWYTSDCRGDGACPTTAPSGRDF